MNNVLLYQMMQQLDTFRPRQLLVAPKEWRESMIVGTGGAWDMPVVFRDLPPVPDFSGCRSPARAKRRLAQGHPQRVTYKRVAYLIDRRAL